MTNSQPAPDGRAAASSHRSRADEGCDGCAFDAPRRAFLQTLASGAALLALRGLWPAELEGATIPQVRAIAARGRTVSYPIPPADGVQVDKGEDVILARAAGVVYAFALTCPHQNTALRWNAKEAMFQCPKHKSRYRPDGAFISGRATRAMDRFAVRHEGGAVVVDLDTLFEQDKDPAGWGNAKLVL